MLDGNHELRRRSPRLKTPSASKCGRATFFCSQHMKQAAGGASLSPQPESLWCQHVDNLAVLISISFILPLPVCGNPLTVHSA